MVRLALANSRMKDLFDVRGPGDHAYLRGRDSASCACRDDRLVRVGSHAAPAAAVLRIVPSVRDHSGSQVTFSEAGDGSDTRDARWCSTTGRTECLSDIPIKAIAFLAIPVVGTRLTFVSTCRGRASRTV